MTEYYDILNTIKTELDAIPFVTTVTQGSIDDVDLNKQTLFPLAHIITNSATPTLNTMTFNLSVIKMDIVDISKDETTDIFVGNDNELDVLNTQLAVLNRLYRKIAMADYDIEIANASFEPFTERFENYLSGWVLTFDVTIYNDMSVC
jgi:hypothetical protein